MTTEQAYGVIANHVFVAYRPYSSTIDPYIIIANTKDEAIWKAEQKFGTKSIHVMPLAKTDVQQVYTF